MSNKAISIDQCIVNHKDGEVCIDLIATFPSNFYTTGLSVKIDWFDSQKKIWEVEDKYTYTDWSEAVESQPGLSVSIPISKVVEATPHAIYTVTVTAANIEKPNDTLNATAVISDVEFVYKCMLNDLVKINNDCCSPVSDNVIRQYLLLYGHTTAMLLGDIPRARYFYQKLLNCGSCGPIESNYCGCHVSK